MLNLDGGSRIDAFQEKTCLLYATCAVLAGGCVVL